MAMKRFHRGGKPPQPKPAPPKQAQRIPKPPPAPKPVPKPAPKPPPPAPVPDENAAAIEILKGNILQAMGAADSNLVETRAVVGGWFLEIREQLPAGAFASWVQRELPDKEKTAKRAIDLYHFREREPALFQKLRPLGLTKAYVLITCSAEKIISFVDSAHLVPSKKHHKTPAQMDVDEMMEVLAGLSNKPAVDPVEKLLQRCRRAANALKRSAGELIAARALIDANDTDDIADIHHDALVALDRLARAFRLDARR